MIDENRAFVHPGEGPVGTGADGPQVIVIAHTGHHEVSAFSSFSRGRGHLATMLFHPGFSLGGGAVIDGNGVPFGLQVAGHRIAHHAQAQECYVCHGLSPFCGFPYS